MPSPMMKKKTTPGLRLFGSRCELDYQVSVGMREQEGDGMSDSSSLDEQIAYSCVDARVFDCVSDRGMGKEELGDFEDSLLETAAKKSRDREADSLGTGSVSNVAIRLPSENHGFRERRDTSPDDQQVLYCEDTYLTCCPDMSEEKEDDELLDDEEEEDSTDEGKKVVGSSNVVRVPSKNHVENCLGNKAGAHTGLQVLACVYVDLNVSGATSMNPRLLLFDADARLIPPRNGMPCLSIRGRVAKLLNSALNYHDNNAAWVSAMSHIQHYPLLVNLGGNDEGRRSTLRCVFDPGGEASPKLLLSTLVVALWFPP